MQDQRENLGQKNKNKRESLIEYQTFFEMPYASTVGIEVMALVERVEITNFVSVYCFTKRTPRITTELKKTHRTIKNTLSVKTRLNADTEQTFTLSFVLSSK